LWHKVFRDVITPEEERLLVAELNPKLRLKGYERGHWDSAIRGFRETERLRYVSDDVAATKTGKCHSLTAARLSVVVSLKLPPA
jgi:hypothetical protein